ncbi:MAG: hypothetical protein ACLTNY_07075, partial [Blautia massiliensis (ex Durand et al. 2017)]
LHIFQVLVGHTELFHQIVHRLDVHGPGAGQAVAFLQGLSVFDALHKDDGRTFFAAYTKHELSPLYEKSALFPKKKHPLAILSMVLLSGGGCTFASKAAECSEFFH